jgi:ATP-dependent helicase HepA
MSVPIGSLINVAALGQLCVGKLHKFDELGRAIVHFGSEGTRILAPKTPIARARLSESTPVRFKTAAGYVMNGEISDFLSTREDGGYIYRCSPSAPLRQIWGIEQRRILVSS